MADNLLRLAMNTSTGLTNFYPGNTYENTENP